MSTERVGIEIEVLGYDGAMSQFKRLEKEMTGLFGKRKRIEVEARLDEVRRNLKALESQKVVIKVDLSNTNKEINEVRQKIEKLRAVKLNLEAKGQKSEGLNSSIKELQSRLHQLSSEKIVLQTNLDQVNQEMSEGTAEANRLAYALKNFKSLNLNAAFDAISTRFAHVGGAMQSLGNALTRFSSITRGITGGFTMGIGYGALGKITEGLKSGFDRYDTMKKYPKIMQQLGYSAEDAQKSVNRLNDAVVGLPTGLDEMVEMAQRFELSLHDMDKSTDLAIAANNAFLASMTTNSQRYQGMLQIQDLLNGKDLTSREWYSLGTSMGFAINEIGKELGYGEDELGEFREALYGGRIETQEFLDALIKVGTGEGSIRKLALESMDTWEAFFSRVGTAFSRMTYGVLTSFDEIVKTVTGGKYTSLNLLIDDMVIPAIDRMTESAKAWISAHPDEIIAFFRKFQEIDWASLGKGFLQGIGAVAEAIGNFAEKFNGKNLASIGKFLAVSGPLGRMITIFGGIIKGSRHIFAGGIVGLLWLIRSIGYMGDGKFIKALEKLSGAKKAIKGAETAMEGAGDLAGAVGNATLSWQGVATGAIAVAAIPAIAGAVKLLASAFKDLEGLKLENMQEKLFYMVEAVGLLGSVAMAIGGLISILGAGGVAFAIGTAAGVALIDGLAITIKDLTGAVNSIARMRVPDKGKVKETVSVIKDIVPDLAELATALSEVTDGNLPTTTASGYATIIQGVTKLSEELMKLDDANIDASKIENANKQVKALKKPIQELAGTLAEVFGTDFFYSNEGTQYGGGYSKVGTKLDSSALTNAATGTSAMIQVIQNFLGIIEPLKNLATAMEEIDGSFWEDVTTKVDKITEVINKMMTTSGVLGSMSKNSGVYQAVASNIELFSTAITSLTDVLKKMSDLASSEMGDIDITAFAQSVGNAVAELVRQLGDTDLLLAKATQLKASIQAIVDAVTALSSEGLGGANFGTLISGLDNVSASADKAKDSVEAVTTALEELGKKKPKVTIQVINATALLRIAAVKDELNKLPSSKSITLSINRTGSTSVGALGRGIQRADGGPVYLAKGGYLMFPKGSDTVPAMLTPGEFVQRKKAVDAFGADFMAKVNNLDFHGALMSLQSKVGRRMNAGNTIINNNYTNNAKVTQIINHPTQDFTFRRASRYVGALK